MTKVTEAIWQEYHQQLQAFIRRRINDHALVEDILQNVFMKIHSQMNGLKDDTKLESWLYQITRNTIIDYYRTHKPTDELPDWVSQPPTDTNEQIRYELARCLQPMIEQLPAKYRDILLLTELQGQTQQTVAQAKKLSLSGVKSRVQRGRALLKGMMFECCQYEFDHRGQLMDYELKNNDCNGCHTTKDN